MQCNKCGRDVTLPFSCRYCGGKFCSQHRIPENHDCDRSISKERIIIHRPTRVSHEYRVSYTPLIRSKKFSRKEVTHLAIGTLLVIGVGMSFFGFSLSFIGSYVALFILLTAIVTSFFAHEMAHKIMAQRRGFWAEFRLSMTGSILTLISIVSPIFKIISPGAVIVSGNPDTKSIGRISIVGPATNILLSIAFFVTLQFLPRNTMIEQSIYLAILYSAALNAWIALFNLIPFGLLDGFKIFLWNRKIWVFAFTVSIGLTVLFYNLLTLF